MAGTDIPALYLGSKWNSQTISYTFITEIPYYADTAYQNLHGPITAFTAEERQITRVLLDYIALIVPAAAATPASAVVCRKALRSCVIVASRILFSIDFRPIGAKA